MIKFVRHLMKIMPQSSYTQRIVHDVYKAVFNKHKPMIPPQVEALRSIVDDFERAQKNKVFKDSRSKVIFFSSNFLIIDFLINNFSTISGPSKRRNSFDS